MPGARSPPSARACDNPGNFSGTGLCWREAKIATAREEAMFEEFGINAGYVEELFHTWRGSPEAVAPNWRAFFAGREGNGNGLNTLGQSASQAAALTTGHTNGHTNGTRNGSATGHGGTASAGETWRADAVLAEAAFKARVFQLINAYRVRGHLFARIDPLGTPADAAPELDLANFGLSSEDLDTTFPTVGVAGLPERARLRDIIATLSETYCGSIGVEFTHIEDPQARDWLQGRMEASRNRTSLDQNDITRIIKRLTDAEMFEQFIHTNFKGSKRFSCEGAESSIALLDLLIEAAGAHNIDEIVIGMAHRGRLNVLVNIMGKHPRELFAAFDDKNPELFLGRGDVKYHLGYSSDWQTNSGKSVHLSLTFNPSHLEFVNPVVEGRVRAKIDRKRGQVMPLLIHGDAAFMGQGVVPETLNLAGLEGFSTGGTIHLVINNQVGFTTHPEDSRSTRYCTDITRMMKVPVFHVNGEDPEAVIQVARLAIEYRQKFAQDVVIDMYCYRKYGHNEGDEPRFTQPLMYKLIDQKPTVREMYTRQLIERGQLTRQDADAIMATSKERLEQALQDARKGDYLKPPSSLDGVWKTYRGGADAAVPEPDTGVARERLIQLAQALGKVPEGFQANGKVLTQLQQRYEKVINGSPFDWGTAEHLAFASLLAEGNPIRISGQDSRRGTFSHRHAVLVDTQSGKRYTPLDHLAPNQASFQVYDSALSETGVLGFEYGYSLDFPEALVIWEAQFGDFANGAQVIIDQFLVSAEDKWQRLSGLVLLLPHGYEGQGPEHSSARIERFLQLAAEDNIQIANCTTPAQIFHLLRRQVVRPLRKPLIVFTPKSLLRLPQATSTIDELAAGRFQRVIGDPSVAPETCKRILLCSGKVYYDLLAARTAADIRDVAIVRLEQLYPLNDALNEALAPYRDGTPLVWVQEEPKNSGAWYFLNAHLRDHIGTRLPLTCVARSESASPATGSLASHKLEQQRLVDAALAR
jgi:2-oxoglutarate dehydrogenase E1 component